METLQRRPTQLALFHGGGAPVQIDADLLTGRIGTVRQVLCDVVREHINDPELLATLQAGGQVDLELYSQGADETSGERHLSPDDDWREVVAELEKANLELGVSRHIRGGAHHSPQAGPGCKHCSRAGKSGASPVRSPPGQQPVVRHPPGYRLSHRDRAEIQNGRSLFFTGQAIAMVNLVCHWFQNLEALWYWTADRNEPFLISDIVIPDGQTLTGSSCDARGAAVLAANRQARKRGAMIVGAGHSHGWMAGNFSSGTDLEAIVQLANERVGFTSISKNQVSHTGRLRKQPQLSGTNCSSGAATGESYEVTFEQLPGIRLQLTTADHSLLPEQFSVELRCDREQLASTFTTHNASEQRFCPVLTVTVCPLCRARLDEHISAEVTIHLVGPEELAEQQRAALFDELREKTGWAAPPRWGQWSQTGTNMGSGVKSTSLVPTGGLKDDPGPAKQAATVQPADFQLWRHNQLIGRIPAAVMERAAHLVEPLAEALGWTEE